MHYQQLELPLNIPATLPKISGTYDISWDNPDTQVPPHAPKSVREQVTFDAESSIIETERDESPSGKASPLQSFEHSNQKSPDIVAPEHSPCVLEQLFDQSAPEHKQLGIQWVEKYWVKRSGKQHYYYRFCWMEGRKIYHKHIGGGNVNSPAAIYRKLIIESALDTATSNQIVALINSFKNLVTMKSTTITDEMPGLFCDRDFYNH